MSIAVAENVVVEPSLSKNTYLGLSVEALMGLVCRTPNRRRRVSVETSCSENVQSVDANTPSPQQVAVYIADMCLELMLMAKAAELPLVAHLLAMAQAEVESAADCVI